MPIENRAQESPRRHRSARLCSLLHKRDDRLHYWEAWEAEDGSVVLHWGEVGQAGEVRQIIVPPGGSVEEIIEAEAEPVLSRRYSEIPEDDYVPLFVQYRIDEWGSVDDLDNRHRVEEIVEECLNATGNGDCDGGDIGSGTANVFAFVVDPYVARDTIVAALANANLLDGAIIAVEYRERYEVLYPPGSGREAFVPP